MGHVMKSSNKRFYISGALVGFFGGLLGGGGGMLSKPLFSLYVQTDENESFRVTIPMVLVLSAVSCCVYFFTGNINIGAALPFMIGGSLSSPTGAKLGDKLSARIKSGILGLIAVFCAFQVFSTI